MYKINDVVQFTEGHKWCGCFGIIEETKEYSDGDVRYMVGVPVPQRGTAYIFSMESNNDFEYVGRAILAPRSEDE